MLTRGVFVEALWGDMIGCEPKERPIVASFSTCGAFNSTRWGAVLCTVHKCSPREFSDVDRAVGGFLYTELELDKITFSDIC